MSTKTKQRHVRKPNRCIPLGLEHLEDRFVPALLQVGTLPGDLTFAQAAAAAQSGDTVQVEPGTYTNFDVQWYANNLTIEAVGGPVILNDSGYSISNEKGIFDIIGNNAFVQGITFENAHDSGDDGHNYAGIRDEGSGLTLDACTFLNNDDGLLVTPASSGTGNVLVEYSVFSNNGYGDGESHNMYINHVSSFTLEYSSTTDAYYGHDVKSRALNTYLLYNFIGDSGSGANDQAALVDLPDGGDSYLIGNVLHKGSSAANGTMIDYNVEGYDDSSQENPTQLLEMVNNTVVNDRSAGSDVLVFGADDAGQPRQQFVCRFGAGRHGGVFGTEWRPREPGDERDQFDCSESGICERGEPELSVDVGFSGDQRRDEPGLIDRRQPDADEPVRSGGQHRGPPG